MMDITEYYAIGVGASIAVVFLASAGLFLARQWKRYARALFLRALYYPRISYALHACATVTRYEALLFVSFIAVNVCCVCVRFKDDIDLVRRMGHVVLINLIFLAAGGHMNPITNRIGIRYEHWSRMHAWVGYLVILGIGIHTAMSYLNDAVDAENARPIPGLIVSFWTSEGPRFC